MPDCRSADRFMNAYVMHASKSSSDGGQELIPAPAGVFRCRFPAVQWPGSSSLRSTAADQAASRSRAVCSLDMSI